MKQYVFAIDVDGVIRDLIKKCVEIYNDKFNKQRTVESVTQYYMCDSFPDVNNPNKWFFDYHSKDVFLKSDIMDNAKNAIDILRKYGKVIIVTYQETYDNTYHTLKWLKKFNIKYDGICFLKNKEYINADFLIDDNKEFLINFLNKNKDKYGVLIDAPYNMEEYKNLSILFKDRIYRAKNLYDFAKNFNKIVKN